MSLGSKINEIRKQKGLSIDELCELSGIPKGTLSKITAGITTSPTLDTVRAIAKALGCKLDDFDDSPVEVTNSPSTAEAAPGEDVSNIFDQLNDMLVSIGLIKDGEDLTAQQAEVLIAICRIINATFQD